ncbi:hypothetical protein NLI96_g4744 [Meripilus lineatus]|uniref:Malate dehydrogenase n=1 Tax=Meripilus lineatus TaxID=2056292 RepID=A0AAD5V9M6_9APHY|nr:hypothetical protein NLI96_g4744 [Physisporinus lineatus]
MIALAFLLLFVSSASAWSIPASGCSISNVVLSLPPNQTQLIAPSTPPDFISIGVGVQNYTCGTTGTFASVGAVAELFDISCLKPSTFEHATDLAFNAWENAPDGLTIQKIIHSLSLLKNCGILGQHYFIPNPITGSGLSPKWDFTSASKKGHPNAFVVGARAGGIPAPTNPGTNVDWLVLNGVQGDLATQIFRVVTRGGQPPTTCTAGQSISVKYASQYCEHS